MQDNYFKCVTGKDCIICFLLKSKLWYFILKINLHVVDIASTGHNHDHMQLLYKDFLFS